MPTTTIDGIATRYETYGSGPPLLLFSPGGFDATVEKWSELGIYHRLRLLDHLPQHYQCIAFDRRESGRSGGRVQRLGWGDYVTQAKGLLDHLGIDRANLIGGCAGCSTAAAFALAHPEAVASMVLFSPAGGARYRMTQHTRFARHLAHVAEHGLEAVVALARSEDQGFGADPRVGPWAPVIRADAAFADAYAGFDVDRYRTLVTGTDRLLFDRDTVPGAEPEDLMGLTVPALVVPGHDRSHATSAARYLEECLPAADYWDMPVDEQTEQTVVPRILDFLAARTVVE
jgi:pimeloyl-ACP methyl ester carboxylesterase